MAAVAQTVPTLAEPRNRIWDEISEMGLEKYVADMDHDGYCTLPPEIANPNNLAGRLLDALVDLAEKRNGERPDLETGATHAYQPKFLYGAKNERYGRSQLKDQTPALKPRLPPTSARRIRPSAIGCIRFSTRIRFSQRR